RKRIPTLRVRMVTWPGRAFRGPVREVARRRRPPAGVGANQTVSARHLLHAFPSFGVGGAQVRFAAIANRFGPKYRHTIVAMDGRHGCEAHLAPNVPFTLLPIEIRKGRPLEALLRIRRTLRSVNPDLLLTYNWGAIEWALANRLRPVCRHVHIEDGFGRGEARVQFRRRVLARRVALSGRSRVIVPSRTLLDIARRVWKLDEGRLTYLPNGVDCDRFAGAADPAFEQQL